MNESMTLYSFILFIYVVSAIGLFVGSALEGLVSIRIGRAMSIEQTRVLVRAFDR
jgi:hypothetical protein